MKINLAYVCRLLLAADGTPHRPLKIRGPHADRQVHLMLAAGFVEATLHDGRKNSFTTINRITRSGHAFLAGPRQPAAHLPFPAPAADTPSIAPSARTASVLEKWRLNFGHLDTSHPMGTLRNPTAKPGEKA